MIEKDKIIIEVLNNIVIDYTDNKVLMVSLNYGVKVKDIIKDSDSIGTTKDIRNYIIKILDRLTEIKDYIVLSGILENKNICPYCFNYEVKQYTTPDEKFYYKCLNCEEDF